MNFFVSNSAWRVFVGPRDLLSLLSANMFTPVQNDFPDGQSELPYDSRQIGGEYPLKPFDVNLLIFKKFVVNVVPRLRIDTHSLRNSAGWKMKSEKIKI